MSNRFTLRNVGCIITGDLDAGTDAESDCILVDDGVIVGVGRAADLAADEPFYDLSGITVCPGLVDGHSHPVVGGYHPRQGLYDFVEYYRRAGIVGLISQGAVHFPGFHGESADVSLAIATATSSSFDHWGSSNTTRVDGACLLATDDMTDAHIADATKVGIRRLKFLYRVDPARRRELSQAAKELDWSVGLHCGGTSVPGTQALDYDAIMDFLPTVLLHLNGGPTALATADIARLVQESDLEIDLVMCGNPAQAISIATRLAEQEDWQRLGLGTDSPTKSGMVPVGLWYMIALLASVGGLPVDKLVAAASTAVATRYWNEDRRIRVGAPATFICIDRPAGGTAEDAMSALGQGDLPGIAGLFINGNFVGGEYNTPPSDRSLQRSQ